MSSRPKKGAVETAAKAELAEIAKRAPELAKSTLAASVMSLARRMDDEGTSSTAAASCARAITEQLRDLREQVPPAQIRSRVDELKDKREERQRAAAG